MSTTNNNGNTPLYQDQRIYDRDYCKQLFDSRFDKQVRLPNDTAIREAENLLVVTFGEEFRWILSSYGSLAFEGFETLGLRNNHVERSELVRYTIALRAHTNMLYGLVVFAAQNDAFVSCCDTNDQVYLYSRWNDSLIPLYTSVATYIAGEGLLFEGWSLEFPENEE